MFSDLQSSITLSPYSKDHALFKSRPLGRTNNVQMYKAAPCLIVPKSLLNMVPEKVCAILNTSSKAFVFTASSVVDNKEAIFLLMSANAFLISPTEEPAPKAICKCLSLSAVSIFSTSEGGNTLYQVPFASNSTARLSSTIRRFGMPVIW